MSPRAEFSDARDLKMDKVPAINQRRDPMALYIEVRISEVILKRQMWHLIFMMKYTVLVKCEYKGV